MCKSARGKQVSFDTQKIVFQEQLLLGIAMKRTMIIHCVGYVGELYDILRSIYAVSGRDSDALPPPLVLHSYSGSKEMMAALKQLGRDVFFSFSLKQILTQKKAQECVRHVDLNRLLVETDAPDQMPPGHVVELNEPNFIQDAIAHVLVLRNSDFSSLSEVQLRLSLNVGQAFQLNDTYSV